MKTDFLKEIYFAHIQVHKIVCYQKGFTCSNVQKTLFLILYISAASLFSLSLKHFQCPLLTKLGLTHSVVIGQLLPGHVGLCCRLVRGRVRRAAHLFTCSYGPLCFRKKHLTSCRVARWCSEVTAEIVPSPQLGRGLCVELACSPSVCVGFSLTSSTVQRHADGFRLSR